MLYDIVLQAELSAISMVRPGVTRQELNDAAKRFLAAELRRIGLIESESDVSRYYYHSIGHHLGLDAHDVGDSERPLEAGMVFTIEPGLYIEQEGIGIRIEDDVLVTETGCDVLSQDILKTADEIEAFMADAGSGR